MLISRKYQGQLNNLQEHWVEIHENNAIGVPGYYVF